MGAALRLSDVAPLAPAHPRQRPLSRVRERGRGEGSRLRNQGRNTTRARHLRADQTDAEGLVWSCLRDRRFLGLKFRRQVAIGPYIADFACVDAKLIVELDGGQHVEQIAYDDRRTDFLAGAGYRVERFWNHDVLRDLHPVLEALRLAAIEQAALTRRFAPPSPARGRGDNDGESH